MSYVKLELKPFRVMIFSTWMNERRGTQPFGGNAARITRRRHQDRAPTMDVSTDRRSS